MAILNLAGLSVVTGALLDDKLFDDTLFDGIDAAPTALTLSVMGICLLVADVFIIGVRCY